LTQISKRCVIEYIAVPRELLYSQLKEGNCNQGRSRLRFKDTIRGNMKKIDMDRNSWQKKAKYRDGWRCVIEPKQKQTAMMMTQ